MRKPKRDDNVNSVKYGKSKRASEQFISVYMRVNSTAAIGEHIANEQQQNKECRKLTKLVLVGSY